MLVLVIGAVGFSVGAATERSSTGHPDVNTDIPCDVCHAEITPEVHSAWYAGKHGKNSVKCFVCHGSIDSDFTVEPANFRCVGCHADQVETAADASCFTCHPPHPLSPHLKKAAGHEEGGDK
jgi:hypothetical protein